MLFAKLDNWNEWKDQLAHATIGAAIVVLFSFVIPILAAVALSLSAAVIREVIQRLKAGMAWWDCREGCRLDLAGWTVGALIGVAIAIVI